jgi:hypothetical protein
MTEIKTHNEIFPIEKLSPIHRVIWRWSVGPTTWANDYDEVGVITSLFWSFYVTNPFREKKI